MTRQDALKLQIDFQTIGVSFTMHYDSENDAFEFMVPATGGYRMTEKEAKMVEGAVTSLGLEIEPTIYGARIQ